MATIIRQDASVSDVWLDFYTDANTHINEAERFTAIATEKSDVIRPFSLTHRNIYTSSTMYCVVCKLNVSTRALRPTIPLPKYAYGQIAVMFSPIFLSMGAKVPWISRTRRQ